MRVNSYSQALSPKRELIVGIRKRYIDSSDGTKINTGVTTVVENYCRDLLGPMKNSLKQEDQIPNITVKVIDNYDLDNELYPSYNGLETGKTQIDCGSEIRINTAPNKKILYSNTFFETGLKLLINKESFDEVTDKKTVSKTILTDKIKNSIKIGLFEKRINVVKILDEEGFKNYVLYKNDSELNDALANGTIKAYVDDPLRMEEFFQYFIKNDSKSQNKFLIYPPELQDYFFDSHNAKLRYVFAFAKDAEDSTLYQNKINEIIKSHTNPLIEKEKSLAKVAKKLYPQPNEMMDFPYLILSKIIEFIKFLILCLLPYRTSIGIVLLVVIKLYSDRKSGVKFEIESFINSIDNMNAKINSLFGNQK